MFDLLTVAIDMTEVLLRDDSKRVRHDGHMVQQEKF